MTHFWRMKTATLSGLLFLAGFLLHPASGESPQLWSDGGGGSGEEDGAVDVRDILAQGGEGRVLWTGGHSSVCRGSVTHLRRDEATLLRSHSGYGRSPYPPDYMCRWLVIPDRCDLAVECGVDTKANDRRSRNSFRR